MGGRCLVLRWRRRTVEFRAEGARPFDGTTALRASVTTLRFAPLVEETGKDIRTHRPLSKWRRRTLSRIPVDEDSVVVVFDRPSDHGNLGTVIRTCEAFGAAGLIITGHAVDLYDPQTVRASMNSLFSLPVVRLSSHREVRSWANGIRKRYPSFRLSRQFRPRLAGYPTTGLRGVRSPLSSATRRTA